MRLFKKSSFEFSLLFSAFIFSCDGGAVTSGNQNTSAPSNLTYSQATVTCVVGTPIAKNIPTVTGTVIRYSVLPPLPTGLSLDDSSGVISGTPALSDTLTRYTIKATNSGGSTTAVVNIAVTAAAPSGLSYTSPVSYTYGIAITNNIPAVTGTVATYTVSPGLPTGLLINPTTGVISGTTAAISPTANYTVTASNSGGSTSATINITVNYAAPSALSYASPAFYAGGVAIINNVPSVIGTVTGYSVSPALPAGLSLNAGTGVISGTPATAAMAAANYAITASNNGGSTTDTVNITIYATPPSNLSYTTPVIYLGGIAIANDVPAVSGTVTNYSASPSLPAGLSLNAASGVVSGIPTATSPAANYTIAASNSLGSTTSIVNLEVTWMLRFSEQANLNSVTWTGSSTGSGTGQLIAVGEGGTLLTSPDGVTWTSGISGTTNVLNSVKWAGNQLVAVGNAGTILTSPDGITWTSRTSGTANNLNSVTWTGNQLVAVGGGETILTSPDGVTWSTRTTGTSILKSVTWTGSQLVAIGGNRTVLTSADGVTWASRTPGGSASDTLRSVTWTGSQLVIVGGAGRGPQTSPDGITWTQRTINAPNLGELFGVTWTGPSTGSGTGQLVAVGPYNTIVTSPDGVSWTTQPFAPTSANIFWFSGITWTGSRLVVVSSGGMGNILTSN